MLREPATEAPQDTQQVFRETYQARRVDQHHERAKQARVAARSRRKPQKQPDYWSVRNMLAAAVRSGVQRDPRALTSCEWDISGNCKSPTRLQRFARPPAPVIRKPRLHGGFTWVQPREFVIANKASGLVPLRHTSADQDSSPWTRGGFMPIWLTQIVRCGKCAPCLRYRARKWEIRALKEYSRSTRTWFVTLTMRPDIHDWIKLQAAGLFEKAYDERRPGDFDALPRSAQFAKRHTVAAQEVTRYLKRLRHTTAVGVRYLLVAEPHESGLPHYHLLIHETGEAKLTKRVLDNRWRWGHTKARLVREKSKGGKAVSYLCKYLCKSNASSPRASIGYGKDVLGHSGEDVNQRHVITNDPPHYHWSTNSATTERQDNRGCTDPSGTVAVGQEGHLEVDHDGRREVGLESRLQGFIMDVEARRRLTDATLGGPGRTQAFKQLAAKGYARRDPAYTSASRVAHALVGYGPSDTGPLHDLIEHSDESDGPLPGLVLEDRRAPDEGTEVERERAELLQRMAAAAVARSLPAARRARIVEDRARIAKTYNTPISRPARAVNVLTARAWERAVLDPEDKRGRLFSDCELDECIPERLKLPEHMRRR